MQSVLHPTLLNAPPPGVPVECNACGSVIEDNADGGRDDAADYDLCAFCLAATLSADKLLRFPHHEHPLVEAVYGHPRRAQDGLVCDVCNDDIDAGDSRAFFCPICSYDVCGECALATVDGGGGGGGDDDVVVNAPSLHDQPLVVAQPSHPRGVDATLSCDLCNQDITGSAEPWLFCEATDVDICFACASHVEGETRPLPVHQHPVFLISASHPRRALGLRCDLCHADIDSSPSSAPSVVCLECDFDACGACAARADPSGAVLGAAGGVSAAVLARVAAVEHVLLGSRVVSTSSLPAEEAAVEVRRVVLAAFEVEPTVEVVTELEALAAART